MAKEYKLSYTAQEIDEKLGKIGEPISWNDLTDKPFDDSASCNQHLVTDEFGVLQWENKPLHKSDRTVITFHTDECTDNGEDSTSGRYELSVAINQLGHDLPNINSTYDYPWTFYFDDEVFVVVGQRLPMVITEPTSKVRMVHIYAQESDILLTAAFDGEGEHTFVFEAGKPKYTQLEYGYMPEGYPKIIAENLIGNARTSYNGSTADNGATYYATSSNFKVENGKTYNFYFSTGRYDAQVYVVTTVKDVDGNIVIGSPIAPFVDPPFYLIQHDGEASATLYWNGEVGATIWFSKNEIQETIVPMDEKFIPVTVARKTDIEEAIASLDISSENTISWNDLTNKPFGSTIEIDSDTYWEMFGLVATDYDDYYHVSLPYFPDFYSDYEELIVEINGTKYTGKINSTSDGTTIGNGNWGYGGTVDTTSPFSLATGNDGAWFRTILGDGTYDIKVYTEVEIITPLDANYLPDSVALKSDIEEAIAGLDVGSGSTGPISWNDLKDKPFGKAVGIKEGCLWEQKGLVATGDDKQRAATSGFPSFAKESYIQEITVEINGTIYKTQFRGGGYGNTIGNGVLSGYTSAGNDEPFAIVEGRGGNYFITTLGEGTYDVRVYVEEMVINRIDPDVLPEGYPKMEYVPGTLIEDVTSSGYISYPNLPLLKDTQYTVIFDNVEYSCNSSVSSYAATDIVIGNLSFEGGEDNGMPFFVIYAPNYNITEVRSMEDGEHTVTIKGPVSQYHSLDDKFIPSTVVRHTDVKDVFTMMSQQCPAPCLVHTFEDFTDAIVGVAYGNGVYVAACAEVDGNTSGLSTATYLYSTDGINWIEKELPSTDNWKDILFGNGVFVLVGYSGSGASSNALCNILYSYDGENWERANLEWGHYNLKSAQFINNEFIIKEGSYKHLHSIDGASWEVVEGAIVGCGEGDLAYCNGVYVSTVEGSSSYNVAYTLDGLVADAQWNYIEFPEYYYYRFNICTDGNKFVAMSCNDEAAFYSYNGIDWLKCKLPDILSDDFDPYEFNISAPIYTHGMFISCVNYGREFWYSVDGITWDSISGKELGLNEEFYYELGTTFRVDDELYCTCRYRNDDESHTGIMHINTCTRGGFVPESVAKEKYATKEEVEALAILTSPNGTKFKLSVADDGTLSAVAVE